MAASSFEQKGKPKVLRCQESSPWPATDVIFSFGETTILSLSLLLEYRIVLVLSLLSLVKGWTQPSGKSITHNVASVLVSLRGNVKDLPPGSPGRNHHCKPFCEPEMLAARIPVFLIRFPFHFVLFLVPPLPQIPLCYGSKTLLVVITSNGRYRSDKAG